MPKLDTIYFINAIKEKCAENQCLYSTFGKVKSVSENGFYVDIETIFLVDNSKNINNIPVLRNKYINHEISEGDWVLLLTLDHLQGDFHAKEELNQEIYNRSYFALPMALLSEFNNATQANSNKGVTIDTSDGSYTINLNKDDGVTISNEQSKITINSEGITITSSLPLAIKTEAASLFDLLNDILTFFQSATTGVCSNGATTTTINSAQLAQLTQFQSTLANILKS